MPKKIKSISMPIHCCRPTASFSSRIAARVEKSGSRLRVSADWAGEIMVRPMNSSKAPNV